MSTAKQHVLLARPGFAELLARELKERFKLTATVLDDAAVGLKESVKVPELARTVFARQVLPLAFELTGDADAMAAAVVKRLTVLTGRANRQTGAWTLHVYGLDDEAAVQTATRLTKVLKKAIDAELSRFAKRYVDAEALVKDEANAADLVVQVYVSHTGAAWASVASLGSGVSPYVAGNLRMRDREGAPSRSARKLEEALHVLGVTPKVGDTAVDLGAAPGGWTFVLARHGASVTAVDHGKLELPKTKTFTERVTHLEDNGLTYRPPASMTPVDWMCCDMLVGSHETIRILTEWRDADLMRHFVVNVKLPQDDPWPVVAEAVALVEAFGAKGWRTCLARHLYHDRKEITLLGSREAP